jgi:hypothetical protein
MHQRVRAALNSIKAAIAGDSECTSNAGVMRSASAGREPSPRRSNAHASSRQGCLYR